MMEPDTQNGPEPDASAPEDRPKTILIRSAIGTIIGGFIGAAAGRFIDTLFTEDPYIGIRVGGFLGAVIGAQILVGSGLVGVGVMMVMIVCSAVGAIVPLAILRPEYDSFIALVPAYIGGIAGAFGGLVLGLVMFKHIPIRKPPEQGHSEPAAGSERPDTDGT